MSWQNTLWGGVQKILRIGENAILRYYTIILRKTEFYTNSNSRWLAILYRYKLSRLQNKLMIHIPINTCGKGLHIMHVGPILINGDSRVGRDLAIHINTALVASGPTSEAPKLGNGIVIGIGAVVVGGVTIADNIAIGANAVVTKSFLENNIAIAGNPAKKVSENGRLNWV